VDEGLGARFWFKLIGIIVLGGIAAILLFLLVTGAWYRWGAIGAIIFFSALVLLWGWIYDKRHKKEYDRLRAEA
jgi:Ca2+/Na+ antiporter